MKTLLKILFIYIPAIIGYILITIALLIRGGYIDYEGYQSNQFNPNDYKPVYSETIDNTQITYHTLK